MLGVGLFCSYVLHTPNDPEGSAGVVVLSPQRTMAVVWGVLTVVWIRFQGFWSPRRVLWTRFGVVWRLRWVVWILFRIRISTYMLIALSCIYRLDRL